MITHVFSYTNSEDLEYKTLEDAFETDTGAGEYEWTATMININSGKNQSVMDSCHVLYEYAVFVAKIKRYRDSMELKEAIDLTVRECIEENISEIFWNSIAGRCVICVLLNLMKRNMKMFFGRKVERKDLQKGLKKD